jgi:hypothetical protein
MKYYRYAPKAIFHTQTLSQAFGLYRSILHKYLNIYRLRLLHIRRNYSKKLLNLTIVQEVNNFHHFSTMISQV